MSNLHRLMDIINDITTKSLDEIKTDKKITHSQMTLSPHYLDLVLQRWQAALDSSKITDEKQREIMSVLLENCDREIMSSPIILEGIDDELTLEEKQQRKDEQHQNRIEILCYTSEIYKKLRCKDIITMQPMLGPVGFAFLLRGFDKSYDDEMGIKKTKITPKFIREKLKAIRNVAPWKLPEHVKTLGQLNEYAKELYELLSTEKEPKDDMPVCHLRMEKMICEAKTHKIESPEVQDDDFDVIQHVTDEIDKEVIKTLYEVCEPEMDYELTTSSSSTDINTTEYVTYTDGVFNGVNKTSTDGANNSCNFVHVEDIKQKFDETLYTTILERCNEIAIATRRGAGNYILVPRKLKKRFIRTMGENYIKGTLRHGAIKVYFQDLYDTTDLLIGYIGPNCYDTGVVMTPYILFQQMKVGSVANEKKGEDKYSVEDIIRWDVPISTKYGYRTRYDLRTNLAGTPNYYRTIKMDV